MSEKSGFIKTFGELMRPSKLKLALTLIIAVSAYLLLMATKEAYEMPTLVITGLDGENPGIEQVSNVAVQLSFPVLVIAFPVACIITLLVFGGIPSNFMCDAPGMCELATGTAWIYFAAVLVNLPYYYWLASFVSEAYEKIWKEEGKEFKTPLKK